MEYGANDLIEASNSHGCSCHGWDVSVKEEIASI